MDWLDFALVYDPETRRADMELGEDGDFVLDETPATPMLISFGADRRARDDDELPGGTPEPSEFRARRGWPGDALDIAGRPAGSRLWLLRRAKDGELTRLMAEEWTKEAFAWVAEETAAPADITVEWVRTSVLGLRVVVDGREAAFAVRAA
ncbi:GP46 family protein [Xanthobacter versatilis]|uniref:GP46 family protein n=1 Tax=Xanthobacter autotrophicus (strain ATCC BAA-1158 / Py2) TaxID=78245 RepID=A7INV8_XANP2|nr:GP46 family protein [Xanthobacter autotrophicus Py2]